MGNNAIKGLTVEIDGDTRGLDTALKDLGKRSNAVNKELGQIERALKFDPSSTVLLGQKQALLADKIEATKERLDALKQAQAKVDAMFASGEIDDGQYRAFQRDVVTTENKLQTFEGQLKDVETAQKGAGTEAKELGDKVDKAGDKAKSSGSKFDSFKSGIGNVATAAAATAAAVGAAFVAMAANVLDNADNLQVMSDRTGLTAERLQELQYIGADVGVEIDTISGAQAKLTKSMDAARGGTGKQADAFKALGISVTDSNGDLRDVKDVMGEAFDALNEVGNETERDAIAQKLFGKSAQELNPLIKLGADGMADLSQAARDNGAVMSNEAVAGLDTFGDTLDQMKQGVMGRFGEWFSEVLPDIQGFLAMFQEGGPGIERLIPLETLAQLDTLKQALGEMSDVVMPTISRWYDEIIKPAMDKIGAAFAPVAAEIIPTVTAIVDFVKDNWPAIQKVIEPIMQGIADRISGIMQIIGGVIRTVMAVIRGDWGAAWEGIKTTVSGFVNLIKGLASTFAPTLTNAFASVKKIGGWFGEQKDKAVKAIKELVDKVTGFFKNMKIEFPKIKMPHFKITGEFSLKPPSVPKLGIEWYASGGSFAPGSPSLVGVGDQGRGYEHILRDDQIVSLMRQALDKGRGTGEQHLHFHAQNQSYSETKRSVRDAMEAVAV